jgi:hypothetical protein
MNRAREARPLSDAPVTLLPDVSSDDLITAETVSPTFSARSSTASLVIAEKTISPGAMLQPHMSGRLTCEEVAAPELEFLNSVAPPRA